MKVTPNYILPQLEGADFFDREALNDGFKKIDTAISDLQETFNNSASDGALIVQEVIGARGTEEDLDKRLEKMDNLTKSNVTQLETKANGKVFRDVKNNIICGYEGNKVADDLGQCIIAGGGGQGGRENVIGGTIENINTTTPNNEPMVLNTGANLSRILGGYDNVINGLSSQISADHCGIGLKATHCSIIGGANHLIKAESNFSAINGGINNTIDGSYSIINGGSGNSVIGGSSIINGGSGNKVNGQGVTVVGGGSGEAIGNYSTVCGGSSNKTNGTSSTISGGQNNSNTKNYATISGGFENKTNGEYSTIPGGSHNQTDGNYSKAEGFEALAKYQGEQANAIGKFATKGDAQHSKLILRKRTTDGVKSYITINDGTSALNVPENGTWGFEVSLVARRVDVQGESGMWKINGLAQRVGTAYATLVGTPTITEVGKSTGVNYVVGLEAMANSIYIRVTGETGKTINWVATLNIIQVIG